MSVFADKGSVLVTLQGSIGRVAITQYGAFVDRTVLIFDKYNQDIDKTFWAYIVKEKFIDEARKAPGGTIKTITKEALSDFDLMLPNYEEQKAIGEYFSTLDHLITLHQWKCIKCKQLLINDWEQRKLGEMGTTFTGLSGKTKEDFGHGEAKFITYMNVFSNPVADLHMVESVEIDEKQNSVMQGDVFFTTSSETPDEVGMSCVMPQNTDNVYLNSFCFGYRPTEKFDLNYLAYVLRADAFRKEMTFLAQGISRYNISKNKVMEVKIPIPSLEEQLKVGSYFATLDHLITLHQWKCIKCKQLLINDWEQRKLGEVFEQTANFVNPKKEDMELWSLTVENGLTEKSDRYNREFLVKKDDKFKEVRPGDIVYNPMNMTLGAVGYNAMSKSVAVSGYYTTMVAKEAYDAYYINMWLKSPQAILLYKTYATGTLIEKQRVQFPTLSIIPAMFPKVEEQQKIGTYFKALDNLITLHQQKGLAWKKAIKYAIIQR